MNRGAFSHIRILMHDDNNITTLTFSYTGGSNYRYIVELMVILTQKYVTVISVESIWEMCLASTRLMLVERKDETYPCQYSKKLLSVSLKYLQKFQRNRLATDDYSTYQHSGIEIATELIQDLVQRVVDVREISREFYKFYDAELYSPECK